MSVFTPTVEAILANRTVNAALLFTITFPDAQVLRLWTGDRSIVIGGNTYKGAGRLISIDGLQSDLGVGSPTATFRMSGVNSEIAALIASEKANVPGCDMTLAVQVFGTGEGGQGTQWQPQGSPVVVGTWKGERLSMDRSGPSTYVVSIFGVSLFATGGMARQSFYSDRDQNRRYSGDRGAEFMTEMGTLSVRWPFGLTGS